MLNAIDMENSFSGHITTIPPSIREAYGYLRLLAIKHMDGAHEMVYHNAMGYSLSKSPWDRVCYIAHQPKDYINFGFFFGSNLLDPSGLIQGSGKRMRHVKIYTLEQAQHPALKDLVIAAWKNAPKDVAGWRESLKQKKQVQSSIRKL